MALTEEPAEEEWRPIPGEEHYQVSDLGRIRRRLKKSGRLKVLNPTPNKKLGYIVVCLGCDCKPANRPRKLVYLHRLVLEAFVGPPPFGHEGRHHNGVRHDNRLQNLSWATRKENFSDKLAHGTLRWGEKVSTKLTEADVREIRASKETNNELSRRYGIGGRAVRAIRNRHAWRHLED